MSWHNFDWWSRLVHLFLACSRLLFWYYGSHYRPCLDPLWLRFQTHTHHRTGQTSEEVILWRPSFKNCRILYSWQDGYHVCSSRAYISSFEGVENWCRLSKATWMFCCGSCFGSGTSEENRLFWLCCCVPYAEVAVPSLAACLEWTGCWFSGLTSSLCFAIALYGNSFKTFF